MAPKIHVAHILVNHKYEAEDVLRKLREGADFAEMAKRISKCPSAASGGDLGVVLTSRLDEDFLEAAEKLGVGEISEPVRTRFGYHLIKGCGLEVC